MTDTPHTVDDLLDLWDDHTAPTESMLRHPSHYRPTVANVLGTNMQVVERTNGTFAVSDGHRWVSEGHATGADAYFAALALHRCRPRAESQGRPVPDSDPLAPARGIILATAVMLCVYAGVYVVLRWRGVL
jgi:hypothetical protein